MSNRIDQLFAKKKDALTLFFTAGFPQLEDTMPLLRATQAAGVDLVEIGLPFSDPLADGPTIQKAGEQALANGMSTEILFEQLEGMRTEIDIPVVIMGHFNPVLRYGVSAFCKRCQELGIDGLILPDLPPEVYERNYKSTFDVHGIHLIFLITPETSSARRQYLDSLSGGFLYAVSSSSTTGGKMDVSESKQRYFADLRDSSFKNPVQVGFGIGDREALTEVHKYVSGGVVGSAFIRQLQSSNDLQKTTQAFVSSLRTA